MTPPANHRARPAGGDGRINRGASPAFSFS
nr:MAG TPA: hypothetical protein [Caudoviricetes sp.]